MIYEVKKFVRHKLVPIFSVLAVVAVAAGLVWYIFYRVNTSVQQVVDTSKLSSTDPDVKMTQVVEGLKNPVAVVFPNNTAIFYGVLSGEVRARLTDTADDWTLLTPAGIRNTDGFGLLSLLVDKEFSDNRYLYACYATASDIRLTRYEIAKDLKSVVTSKDILTGIEAKSSKNSSCALTMDAVGTIWVGTGDSEIASAPQNPKSLAGKILRITREGTGVGGNQKAPFDDRIFSYGHRKVTGIALIGKLLDNTAYGYAVDQGDSTAELNYLMSGNFGYDPAGGLSANLTDKTKHPTAIDAIWNANVALDKALLIKPLRWQAWQNRLFISVANARLSKVVELDENGAFKAEKDVLKDRYGVFTSIIEAPDNTIYGTMLNGDNSSVFQLKVVCTVCG